jgi:hypothetical protein
MNFWLTPAASMRKGNAQGGSITIKPASGESEAERELGVPEGAPQNAPE